MITAITTKTLAIRRNVVRVPDQIPHQKISSQRIPKEAKLIHHCAAHVIKQHKCSCPAKGPDQKYLVDAGETACKNDPSERT